MRALLSGGPWRVASAYTVALWLAGFVWAKIDLAATGHFFGLLGLLSDLPGILVTIVFALALQSAVIVAHERKTAGRLNPFVPLPWVAALLVVASLASGGADTLAHAYVAERWLPAMRVAAGASRAEWLRVSFVYSWMYSLNVALVVLAITTEEARRRAAMLAQAREAAQVAQLTMLRYQLNPHFLFNSLNAISSLVLTRQNDAAERMIDRLATFLRSTAASDPGGLVPLADELSTIQDYLDVEAVRFGDRMRVRFDIAAGTGDYLVPSFLVQPLVENAIKYAIAPRQGDGEIRIEAREAGGRLTLAVADDGDAQSLPGGGTGIGLANVCARLKAFYGDDAECRAGRVAEGFTVVIAMPARRAEPLVVVGGTASPDQAVAAPRRAATDATIANTLAPSAISSPPMPSFK